jgi:hypothetical protein
VVPLCRFLSAGVGGFLVAGYVGASYSTGRNGLEARRPLTARKPFSALEVSMRDFAIHLTHRPGELARVTNALARKGVNLKSVAAIVIGSQGVLRLIADDVEATRAALSENHIPFEENEVVTVLLENHAGELENVADKRPGPATVTAIRPLPRPRWT